MPDRRITPYNTTDRAESLFYTIRKAKNEENRAEKRKHLFIGFFPLMVIAGGLIQTTLFPYIPIYCFTCLILMLVFYIQSIELRISVDPLTNLNNRGQLMRYISQKSSVYQEGRQTFVVMMDIDGFKGINDTYGHAEGDKTLVTIADSLKTVLNRHCMPFFLGRYGGDEFILIVHPDGQDQVEQLISEIRDEIQAECAGPVHLSISAGYDELLGGQDTLHNCIQRADKKLYLDKQYRKLREKEEQAEAKPRF